MYCPTHRGALYNVISSKCGDATRIRSNKNCVSSCSNLVLVRAVNEPGSSMIPYTCKDALNILVRS
jgi:hypothetical protein